ncbi:MAG: phospho-N-acetylmuramoyl-pentapeptide-transferase [Ruminococcus sp.]|nr:phospho-N-acetylmuramoyl-pentapeptide-transferase [Ruminococcus sp.]
MQIGFWAFGTAVVCFAITAAIGRFLVPFLHKLHFGQTILDIGPSWHKNKQGTPTMGGFMFIIGIVITTTAGVLLHSINNGFGTVEKFVFVGLCFALCNGAIGFFDDYVKVAKKRNLGLTAWQKLILQFAVAGLYLFVMHLCGDTTEIAVPFSSTGLVDLGFFYYILMALVLVGMNNAVNLTDGVDGLDGSITFFVALFLMLIANVVGYEANVIFAASVAGGCLGFLVWNFHPAKCFMGDTGSLFLGGIVCALAFVMDMQLLLILIGIMYLVEMFSVMLQVGYFKLTKGKRLFKMSPIHHHFEMSGWSEMKIVCVFSLVTAIAGAGALLLVIFG